MSQTDRQHAHDLIDRMAPGQLSAVVGLLEVMVDPVARALANAPLDDEPAEPMPPIAEGPGMSHEAFLAELNITQSEIDAVADYDTEIRKAS